MKPWECSHPGCRYRAKLKSNLNAHLKLHDPNLELRKPFVCTFQECDFRASTKKELKCHVDRRHTSNRTRDFPCALCLSRFYTKNELNQHFQSHVKEKRFACDFCNYKAHAAPSLRVHMRNVHEKLVDKRVLRIEFHSKLG